jgi:uncharacterized SAM-binding protein YcdF (DUF218 family)
MIEAIKMWLLLLFGAACLLAIVLLGPFIWMAGMGALALVVVYAAIVHDPVKKQPP